MSRDEGTLLRREIKRDDRIQLASKSVIERRRSVAVAASMTGNRSVKNEGIRNLVRRRERWIPNTFCFAHSENVILLSRRPMRATGETDLR